MDLMNKILQKDTLMGVNLVNNARLTPLDPVHVKNLETGETEYIKSPLLNSVVGWESYIFVPEGSRAKCIRITDGVDTITLMLTLNSGNYGNDIKNTLDHYLTNYMYRQEYFKNFQKQFNGDDADFQAFETAMQNDLLVTLNDIIANADYQNKIFVLPHGYYYIGNMKKDDYLKQASFHKQEDNTMYYILGALGLAVMFMMLNNNDDKKNKKK